MERANIVKALEICANYKGCSDCAKCPLHNDEYVQCEQNVLESLALALIKELTEECENYKKVGEKQQSLSMDRHFEIKRLTEDNKWSAKRIIEADKMVLQLNKENERLTVELEAMRGAANSYKMHNERLTEENETLTIKCNAWHLAAERVGEEIQVIKANTMREFAERLKAVAYQSSDWSHGEHPMVVEVDDIEEILNENTEDEKK